ncbi:HTH-type transcriptional regulator YhaJ [Saezia sanguinis]|uniref:HTH-type transcriptional regulator YhaJ n=1 Tax=Saezia sanguinis TaxID=1965230 RepID=A0A433SFQ8_9BURK|nr:LysR family transcriptional regulator [Saezia sanguinis]RUS67599.1 HTH-type transcriptional regulator YhaJ [Saezia sanguinis]
MNEKFPPLLHASQALGPQAIALVDLIARSGSFAAAARELGKVPSSLTYTIRQLEENLDVLLFDRSSRQAKLTAAGEELLREGLRVLEDLDAVANRIRRIATGWESVLTIAVDSIINLPTMLDLVEAFYALHIKNLPAQSGQQHPSSPKPHRNSPPTRIRLRAEVLSGSWEALASGQADLILAIEDEHLYRTFCTQSIGQVPMVYCVAAHHPLAKVPAPLSNSQLAKHRVIAIADTARVNTPMTLGIQPGQDVLTVPSLTVKLHAQLRGLGGGYLPQTIAEPFIEQGLLITKATEYIMPAMKLVCAWRDGPQGNALKWWLNQLASPATCQALTKVALPLIS